MLKKLQEKWKVNGWNLILIISTFALGGSICGYAGRKILLLANMEKGVTWFILYIILITLLWPVCVLLVSIPMGQFRFFRRYIIKVWNRIFLKGKSSSGEGLITRIAIFASGTGSNAEKIIAYFKNHPTIKVHMIVSNKEDAAVIEIAKKNNIIYKIFNRKILLDDPQLLADELRKGKIDFIILAGFLLKIPVVIIHAYQKRIINIHPALLPRYGGEGMYGMNVHQAVIANKEKKSGLTIHYVDEVYDHGEIIFQQACDILPTDTPLTLAKKIQALEHMHFPSIIEKLIRETTIALPGS